MGDHRLPKRVMSGELENTGKRGPGGKENKWTDCVGEDLRLYLASRGTGAPPHLTLGPGIAHYVKGAVEEKAPEHRHRKREAEEADKVEVAPRVIVTSLRRFRAALIGLTQGLRKRRRPCL